MTLNKIGLRIRAKMFYIFIILSKFISNDELEIKLNKFDTLLAKGQTLVEKRQDNIF